MSASLGIPKAIDLLALEEQAVVPVKLPTGRVVDLHFFDAVGYTLFLTAESSGDEDDAQRVLAHIMPDATPRELQLLTTKMVTHLALVAARKIAVVLEVLEGNGGGPPAPESAPSDAPAAPAASDPSPPRRSGRPTRRSTRSHGSGGSGEATSSRSPASPSTASSSPSSA